MGNSGFWFMGNSGLDPNGVSYFACVSRVKWGGISYFSNFEFYDSFCQPMLGGEGTCSVMNIFCSKGPFFL